jgi:hypothetical protein
MPKTFSTRATIPTFKFKTIIALIALRTLVTLIS